MVEILKDTAAILLRAELLYELSKCLGGMDYQRVYDLAMVAEESDLLLCLFRLFNKHRRLANFILTSRINGRLEERLPADILDKSRLPPWDQADNFSDQKRGKRAPG